MPRPGREDAGLHAILLSDDDGLCLAFAGPRETCDELFRIPARGPVGTLNVSNAAAVAMAALTAPP